MVAILSAVVSIFAFRFCSRAALELNNDLPCLNLPNCADDPSPSYRTLPAVSSPQTTLGCRLDLQNQTYDGYRMMAWRAGRRVRLCEINVPTCAAVGLIFGQTL